MACDGCHTPRIGKGFNMSKRFSGGSQVWEEEAYTVRGSNITPDRESGIGAWTEDDLKRSMVHGTRPNGIPLAPQMPFPFYKILTPRDLKCRDHLRTLGEARSKRRASRRFIASRRTYISFPVQKAHFRMKAFEIR